MTWEEIGYLIYFAVAMLLVIRVPLPNPLPGKLLLGMVIGTVIWPVLLLNQLLGIGGKR